MIAGYAKLYYHTEKEDTSFEINSFEISNETFHLS